MRATGREPVTAPTVAPGLPDSNDHLYVERLTLRSRRNIWRCARSLEHVLRTGAGFAGVHQVVTVTHKGGHFHVETVGDAALRVAHERRAIVQVRLAVVAEDGAVVRATLRRRARSWTRASLSCASPREAQAIGLATLARRRVRDDFRFLSGRQRRAARHVVIGLLGTFAVSLVATVLADLVGS